MRLDHAFVCMVALLSEKVLEKAWLGKVKILNIYNFYPCSVSKKLLILARRLKNGDKIGKFKDKRIDMYCILAALLVKSFKKYAKRA